MKWYRWVLTTLVVLLAIALGIAAGAWLFRPVQPEGLETAVTEQDSPVAMREVDDKRSVQLAITQGSEVILKSASSGLLTDFSCSNGSVLESGAQVMRVNGSPTIALATSNPLWRDLKNGDTGDDVLTLQEELQRLGYAVVPDGEVGPYTLRSTAQLLGLTKNTDIEQFSLIPAASFLWIPQPSVTIAQCQAQVGQSINLGDDIASLTKTLKDVHITEMPQNLLAGEHILTVGTLTLPMNEDGVVTDAEALNQLQQQPEYEIWLIASKENPQARVNAELKLQKPQSVYLVSPAAIYNIDGNSGCVNDKGAARQVTIVSSELGQSFVTFNDGQDAPTTLALATGNEPTCK